MPKQEQKKQQVKSQSEQMKEIGIKSAVHAKEFVVAAGAIASGCAITDKVVKVTAPEDLEGLKAVFDIVKANPGPAALAIAIAYGIYTVAEHGIDWACTKLAGADAHGDVNHH